MHADARAVRDALGLKPHPEGGFFRETFRSSERFDAVRDGMPRDASTAIYFLLPAGEISAWHRVRSDEVWHFYDGDALELVVIEHEGRVVRHDEGRVVRRTLGRDLERGERPQAIVPAGHFQAARCLGERFTLCGCTVAPGFDFADFELPSRAAMLAKFPQHEEIVRAFGR
jgi:predicted cupin superfamily sugar epimerase